MRTLQKYFCLILTAMVLIVPDLCHAARNVAQRNTDEITQHDVSQNVTSGGRTTNRATTNTARAGNNARRESSTSRRESSSRGTASRTSNAGARATQSRTARTAQAGHTAAVTARNASAQVRSATNTRAARSAATAHGAPTTAVKSRAATSVQPRASANNVMARTRNASAVSLVNNNITDLMAQCKTKYTQCMDDFCNVLDDAQGRCSCSKNLKNYAKTSTAQDEANAALQDIAQQIQYIGLSRDEIETVFKQTEAELALQGSSDNSQIKNSLDKIKDMIVEVKPGSASAADADTGFSFNLDGLLDFSFDSVSFDLTSLFGTNSANTSSISNQRGEQLYKTASARCKKNVLEACQAQGINTVLIENSYDLEIDRACIAYEKELTDGNDNIAQTVRNAQSVLQRARLMVAQQKNIYDLRNCVGALDSCMQDDFVCGDDYELCLDPTGKYIVEGEVVVGSTPGYTSNANPASDYATNTLMGTWYYDNKFAWAPTPQEGSLIEYIAKYVTSKPIKNTSSNIAEFLQYKIGYNEDDKNYGMCMSVLNKCQDLTYDKTSGKYIPNNQVVTEYLTRTLTQIKSAQDKILFEYAESCITDVASCLSSNNFDTAATEKKQNIAINACRAQIKTCMSVNGNSSSDPGELRNWVVSMMGAYDEEDGSQPATPGQSGTSVPGSVDEKNCVTSGGTWSTTTQICNCNKVGTKQNSARKLCECDTANNFAGTPNKNSGCSCADGYELVGTQCVLEETGDDPKPGQSSTPIDNPYTQDNPKSPMVRQALLTDVSTGNQIAVYKDKDTNVCYANPKNTSNVNDACVVNCNISSATSDICSANNTVTLTVGNATSNGLSFSFNGLNVPELKIALENGQLPSSLAWVRDLANGTYYRFDGIFGANDTQYYDINGNCVRSSITAGSTLTAVYTDTRGLTCTESGGSWSNESCSCTATGTIYDDDTAACICDTANHYTGTPTLMGCQCAEGYEFVNGACQLKETGGESGGSEPEQPEQPEPEQPSIAQQNCENTGGEWTDNTCDCGTGYTWKDSACISTEQDECEVLGKEWTGNTCDCGTEYIWKDSACISTEQDACERFGGEWTDNTCDCGTGYTWKNSACISTEQAACERVGGEWTDNTCKCGDGYVWTNLMCKSDAWVACENEGGTWNSSSSTCVCSNNYIWHENRCISKAEHACISTMGTPPAIWSNGTCTCPGELKWYSKHNDCESEENITCYENGGTPWNMGCNMCSGPEYENKFVHYNKNTNQCILVENDAYWCSILGGSMDGNVCKKGEVTYWNSANGPTCSAADATSVLGGNYDLYNAYLCSCKLDYTHEHSTGQLVDDKCACLNGFERKSIDLCSCPDNAITFTTSVWDYESTELIYKAYKNVTSVPEMETGTMIEDLPVVSSSPFSAQDLGRSIELADWFIRDDNNKIVTMPCNIYKSNGHYHCNSMCIKEEKLEGICLASGGTWDSVNGCTSCSGMGMTPNMIQDFTIYKDHHVLSGKNLLCSCNVNYMWVADPDKPNSCRCPEYESTKTGHSIQLQPMTESDMQDANDPGLWGLNSMPKWDGVEKCVLPGTLLVHVDRADVNMPHADYYWACDKKHGFVDHQENQDLYDHQSTTSPSYSGEYYELLDDFLQRNSQENPDDNAPRCMCPDGWTQVYVEAKQKHVCVKDESEYRTCGYDKYDFEVGKCKE